MGRGEVRTHWKPTATNHGRFFSAPCRPCAKRLPYWGAVPGTRRARRIIKAAVWLTSRCR
eukprot:COSAG01_NODE_60276_length_295_cov_1.683673_1_plen_59_part_01